MNMMDDTPVELPLEEGAGLLSPLLSAPASNPSVTSARREPVHGVALGQLLALTGNGCQALVVAPILDPAVAHVARIAVRLAPEHIGRGVLLAFEHSDPSLPIVIGVICSSEPGLATAIAGHVELSRDGEQLTVVARDRLVLRCGDASITLTQAGKVIIDGNYIVSRSKGVNRSKGASIQLN